jgi:hypothetical protein
MLTQNHKTLSRQREILTIRERLLERLERSKEATPEAVESIDLDTMKELSKICPAALLPVLVRPSGWSRENSYFAAYLIGATPGGGLRLLRIDKTWHITRIKSCADVIKLKKQDFEVHKQIVELQKQCDSLTMDIVEKCHTHLAKDSPDPKSRKQTVKSS